MPILTKDLIESQALKLPAVSSTAMQLVSMIDDPKTTREQIVELVETDATILAQCFKQAHSVAMGFNREYKSIPAIMDVLGFSHIRKVGLFVAAKSVVNDPKIWFESVFLGVAAQYLARKAGLSSIEADKVYMAGLFVNFGAYFLKHFYPAVYAPIQSEKSFLTRIQNEKSEFGMSCPEISAIILELYKLPTPVIDIVTSQELVYQSGWTKENAFIEVARLMFNLQTANDDTIKARLDINAVRKLVAGSKLPIHEIDREIIKNIEVDAREYAAA